MASIWGFVRLSESFYVRPMAFEESEENYTKEILPILPDIIVSVYNEKRQKHVSYYKFRPEDYYDFSINQVPKSSKAGKMQNIFMDRDESFYELEGYGGGLLTFKMRVLNKVQEAPVSNIFSTSSTISPSITKVRMCVNFYQGKMLPASDNNSLSDPQAYASHLDKTVSTQVVKCSLNPLWLIRKVIDTEIYQVEGETFLAPLVVKVFDHDDGGLLSSDSLEFLGMAAIPMEDMTPRANYGLFKNPEWYNLRYSDTEGFGKILMSYTLHPVTIPIPQTLGPLIEPSMVRDYMVKIKILGLRDLQSPGLFEISRAKIILDASSLKSGGNGGDYYSKLTCLCKDSGPNPTVGKVMNMESKLFKLDYGKPTITCTIFDVALFGLSNSSLGTFEIGLEKYSFYSKIHTCKILRKIKQKILDSQAGNRTAVPKIDNIVSILMMDLKEDIRNNTQMDLEEKFPEIFKFKQNNKNGKPNPNQDIIDMVTLLSGRNPQKPQQIKPALGS